jgi:hypothetical protein
MWASTGAHRRHDPLKEGHTHPFSQALGLIEDSDRVVEFAGIKLGKVTS